MRCPFCDEELKDNAIFCSRCGRRVRGRTRGRTRNDDYDYAQYRQLDDDEGYESPFRNEDIKTTEVQISKVAFVALGILSIVLVIVFFVVASKIDIKKKAKLETTQVESETDEIIIEESTTQEPADDDTSGVEESEVEEPGVEESEDEESGDEEDTEDSDDRSAMDLAQEGLRHAEDFEPLEYNGHVYAIFNFHDLELNSFNECQTYCRRMGGHLAVISSEEENKAIYDYLLENDRDHTFFGFTDQDDEGIWEWVDYSDVTYTNWAQGQPNNSSGKEHYAQFNGKDGGTWNDAKFGSKSWRFLCEWE